MPAVASQLESAIFVNAVVGYARIIIGHARKFASIVADPSSSVRHSGNERLNGLLFLKSFCIACDALEGGHYVQA